MEIDCQRRAQASLPPGKNFGTH